MDTVQFIQNYTSHGGKKQKPLSALFESLSEAERKELAQFALEQKDEDFLLNLACFTREGLAGFHIVLIEQGHIYPGILFRNAGPEAREALLEKLEATEESLIINHILGALAWIGDERVVERFRQWRNTPPAWADALFIPPHEYALEGGWQLSSDGHKVDLTYPLCYPFFPSEEQEQEKSPTRVALDRDEPCPWCNRPLVTLFDLDLTRPEMNVINLSGIRLRIATCEACTCFDPLYMEVDWEGRAHWSPHNRLSAETPEGVLDGSDEWQSIPRDKLTLSEFPRSVYHAAHEFSPVSVSQLGGYPTWIQDAEYPTCPGCRMAMKFVAQLAMDEVDDCSDGIYYAFLCHSCRLTATHYQQS